MLGTDWEEHGAQGVLPRDSNRMILRNSLLVQVRGLNPKP